jgi:plasmid stabilization system protein ParE
MKLKWTTQALSDPAWLYESLSPVNKQAAARVVQTLVGVPARLVEHPRMGEALGEFKPRDVRRLLVGQYEMRYEIQGPTVCVLRIWHPREDRL